MATIVKHIDTAHIRPDRTFEIYVLEIIKEGSAKRNEPFYIFNREGLYYDLYITLEVALQCLFMNDSTYVLQENGKVDVSEFFNIETSDPDIQENDWKGLAKKVIELKKL